MSVGKDVLKVIAGGLVFAVITFLINMGFAMLTMNYYTMPDYFAVWSKIMMPTAGPPPMSFDIIALAFNWIGGMIFVAVYLTMRGVFEDKPAWKKGAIFGALIFLVATIPNMLSMYILINLPAGLLVWWTLQSLIGYLLGGIVIAGLAEKM
jgi:hypothetical protein